MNVGASDGAEEIEMGPLIRQEHRQRVAGYLDIAAGEGAKVALDGRRDFDSDGFLIGPSVIDQVKPEMRVAYRRDLRSGAVGDPRQRSRFGAGDRA